MYKPCICYQRSPQEKADKFLAWNREDTAFFASGACHILAFLFMELRSHEKRYKIIGLKAKQDKYVHHVYVTDGVWAFDYAGWTLEEDLLSETKKAHVKIDQDWDYERIVITQDLETFCKQQFHRPPSYFPYLPWERAYNYIKKFPSKPEENQ